MFILLAVKFELPIQAVQEASNPPTLLHVFFQAKFFQNA